MPELDVVLAAKYQQLQAILLEMGSLIIGLSGGVDSVLLAKVAYDVLGERALAVTADSASLPRRELRAAQEIAQSIGIRFMTIKTQEVSDPRYAANPVNRCYYCKYELFSHLDRLVAELGYRWVCYGENEDDKADHRPGGQAAREHQVRAPLKEAGLTKPEIRTLAQFLGLPVWDKPAFACLSSRFPYGQAITPQKLAQVEAAEELLWELGFRQYRVRHHGEIARLEVGPGDMPKLLAQAAVIVERLRQVGFTFIPMDLAGYQRGSLNQNVPDLELIPLQVS